MGTMVTSHEVGDLLTFSKHIFIAISLNEQEIATKTNLKIKNYKIIRKFHLKCNKNFVKTVDKVE